MPTHFRNIKMKTADDFRESALKNPKGCWKISDCSICGCPLIFIFSNRLYQNQFLTFLSKNIKPEVQWSGGCYCVYKKNKPRASSWQEIADHYNLQIDQEIIKKYNDFWGFNV